jgi:preprotein translocase subunit SecB
MRQSPLQLERYVITEFNFQADITYKYSEEGGDKVDIADLTNSVKSYQRPDDLDRWLVELDLELPPSGQSKYPYSLKIVLVGFFCIDSSYPAVERVVRVNGPSMLFTAAREFVATVTGRGPYLGMWLPTVSFAPPPATKPEADSPRGSLEGQTRRRIRKPAKVRQNKKKE